MLFLLFSHFYKLTLGSNGVRNWAGIAEAVRIHCSDHEEVNGPGLEGLQDVALCLHMFGDCHPSVA